MAHRMMVAMTPDDLRKLADEATPGPWKPDDDPGTHWLLGFDGGDSYVTDWPTKEADLRLLALAPDLARLCADLAEALLGEYRNRHPEEVAQAMLEEIAKLSELEAK
jgi:hypothetical protein